MKKNLLKLSWFLCFIIQVNITAQAQEEMNEKIIEDSSWKKNYRSFATKENDLVHTKLVANFDYTQSQLNGEVWLQIRPHFYATSQLILDAKGMDIHNVSIVKNETKNALKYKYDGNIISIDLDKTYTAKDTYTVYIKYTAKPNEYKAKGSSAITDAKGLYFINPLGKEKNKPTQIWTQGETEGTSVWMPIIDKPNQKCTQEFYLNVPSKYVSLSNGLLVKQVDNKNGTRLDVWKMDLPHSPYLFFIGIGDYAVIKQDAASTNNKKKLELSYYIEKEFEKEAVKIYGKTPQMIALFEKLLGVPFPWAKYAQISGRDYVSGAMENTTATLHSDAVQQDARELVDENIWEGTIAHELFHQWFGDLVTAESWSNLTVNESFADYSQTIWLENSMGKDAGDYENYKGLSGYLSSPMDAEKNLVRFFYNEREDMFDLVSYQKGGRILHMLRHFVGDEAFYKSLNKYLTDHKFSNGSAIKLKLAFESVTGEDLNWFFDQWFMQAGHPHLNITHSVNKDNVYQIKIIQKEKRFKLYFDVDVLENGSYKRQRLMLDKDTQVFSFPNINSNTYVQFDAQNQCLGELEEIKDLNAWKLQLANAQLAAHKLKAFEQLMVLENDSSAKALYCSTMLSDPFWYCRVSALGQIAQSDFSPTAISRFAKQAKIALLKEPSSEVRKAYVQLFTESKEIVVLKAMLNDSSFNVVKASLLSLTPGFTGGHKRFNPSDLD